MGLAHATLYLHIGLPKTGTTFLQERILPRLDSLFVRCKPQTELVERAYPWESGLRSFFDRSPAIWDDLGDRLFAELLDGCEEGRDILVSDENLAPSMRYPRAFRAPPRADFGCGPFSAVAHLRELSNVAGRQGYPCTRVLLTVRRQDTWLASAYAQDSDRWPDASQADFDGWVASILDPAVDYWSNGLTLDYALLWRLVSDIVGTDNVLVLPYELMRENLTEFLSCWIAFLGTADRADRLAELAQGGAAGGINVRSKGDSMSWNLRPIRPPRDGPSLPWRVSGAARRWRARAGLGSDKTQSIRLTHGLQEKILSTYRPSNRRLAALIDADLASYGYL